MREKVLLVRCPVTTIRLNQVEAPVFRLGSQLYLKSSDLGKILGFAQPASAISHLRRYHRAEIEPHVCKAWLGVQRGPQNIARLISLQGCAILAAKVTKPEAKTAKAAFAALQLQLASLKNSKSKEDINMSQEDCKTKIQPIADAADEDAPSQTAGEETATTEIVPVRAEQEADTTAKDLPVVDGPAKVVEFHGQEVPVYEVNGELYLTGETLGSLLGLAEPRKGIWNIFERHREELEPYTCVTNLMTQVDNQKRVTRLYSQEGCYLISMFARTDTAKEVRQWLAALPRKVRQVQEAAPETLEKVKDYFFKEVVPRIFHLLSTPVGIRLGYKQLERLTQLRAFGLITQKEAARLYNISVETVRSIEKEMSVVLGLEIKPMNQYQRDRHIKHAIESLLEYQKAREIVAASLEAPKDRKKMH